MHALLYSTGVIEHSMSVLPRNITFWFFHLIKEPPKVIHCNCFIVVCECVIWCCCWNNKTNMLCFRKLVHWSGVHAIVVSRNNGCVYGHGIYVCISCFSLSLVYLLSCLLSWVVQGVNYSLYPLSSTKPITTIYCRWIKLSVCHTRGERIAEGNFSIFMP